MHEHERKIRPALGAVIVICFFMPFVKLTCGGQPIASITGLNLATGTTVTQPDQFAGFKEAQAYRTDLAKQQNNDGTPEFDQSSSPGNEDPTLNPFAGAGEVDGEIKPEPTAAIALAMAVIAFFAAMGGGRRAMGVSAGAAAVCAVALLILKVNGGGEMPPEMMGIIAIEWTMGFWVAMLGSAVLAGFTYRVFSQQEPPVPEKPKLVIQTYHDKVVS